MNPTEYIEEAVRTESCDWNIIRSRLEDIKAIRALHATIGISDEAGELLEMTKKSIFYGREYTRDQWIDEMGDVMWYMAILADVHDVSFEEILRRNNEKLRARYPDKQFDAEKVGGSHD